MKVQIFTILDYNYGNRLQNYALQEIFKKYNFDVSTFGSNRGCKNNIMSRISDNFLKRNLKNLYRLLRNFKRHDYKKINGKAFKEFNRKLVFEKKIDYNADYYITGSDQVWNLKLFPSQYHFMLGFNKEKKKNIAIAPSICSYSLSKNDKDEISKYIYNFKALSCREEQGTQLLKDNFNVDCHTIIDPTLMLSKEEWMKIEKKPMYLKKPKYILTYFLGTLSIDRRELINKLADLEGLAIIEVPSFKRRTQIGPSEFIYLIHHAELILTDSYHALIFSYIFEKNVRVLTREQLGTIGMNSRMESLKKILDLNADVFCNNEDIMAASKNKIIFSYDNLILEQKKFENYINKIIFNND